MKPIIVTSDRVTSAAMPIFMALTSSSLKIVFCPYLDSLCYEVCSCSGYDYIPLSDEGLTLNSHGMLDTIA